MKKLKDSITNKVTNAKSHNSSMSPIILILPGTALVRNPMIEEKDDVVFELGAGEVIGDSDFLRYPGIDFFGDIYAGPHGLETLVIMAPE